MSQWQESSARTFGGNGFYVEDCVKPSPKDPDYGDLVDERVWLVAKKDKRIRVRLPVPPLNSLNFLPFDRFIVSPDDRIIIADRKIGSGINQAFVFERVHGLHYRLADRASLNKRVEEQFGRPKESQRDTGLAGECEFVLVQQYLRGGHEVLLSCLYGERNSPICIFVTLDTLSGRLSNYHRVDYHDISGRYVG